jgi:hypothetical protein
MRRDDSGARICHTRQVWVVNLHRRNESIPTAVKGLDEPRAFRGITQGETNFIHGLVKIPVKIDESVCRPEFLPNFFPGYEFTGTVQQ